MPVDTIILQLSSVRDDPGQEQKEGGGAFDQLESISVCFAIPP